MERVGWKGRGRKKKEPREVKVPVLEVFKSFAHRVGFVLLTAQVMTTPSQVACEMFAEVHSGQGFWCPSRRRLWLLSGFQHRAATCLWVRSLAWWADKLQHGAGSTCASSRLVGEVPCYRRLPALVGLPWPFGMPNITGTDACYCFKLLKSYIYFGCACSVQNSCAIYTSEYRCLCVCV